MSVNAERVQSVNPGFDFAHGHAAGAADRTDVQTTGETLEERRKSCRESK
jgi:endonuclease IV